MPWRAALCGLPSEGLNFKTLAIMEDVLSKLCNTNELVEIYTNPDDNTRFSVGFVVACSEMEYLVHAFSENDLDDGYYVKRIDSIIRLQKGTTYLRNMMRFIKPKPTKYDLPQGYWSELDLFTVALTLCQQEHLMAEVGTQFDMQFFGWIASFNDTVVEIELVTEDGQQDGTCYLLMEDVDGVGFGSHEALRRTRLASLQS